MILSVFCFFLWLFYGRGWAGIFFFLFSFGFGLGWG